MDNITVDNQIETKKQSNKGFFIWLAFLLIYLTFFNITFVSGDSMDPSLKDKDILIMEKASILFDNLNRGDIISFRQFDPNNRYSDKKTLIHKDVYFIKRIIGIPGDVVEVKNGSVYVNGERIQEDYLAPNTLTFSLGYNDLKMTLAEDEYFVLGDNRGNSMDSRFSEVGAVRKEDITAKHLVKVMNLG